MKSDIASSLTSFGAFKPVAIGGPETQPKERLISADKARALIDDAFEDLKPRLEQYRAVQDAYDRIPPDTEMELAADGFDGLANVNWGGMQSGVDDNVEVYLNLALEPETFVHFYSRVKGAEPARALNQLAKNHAELLRDWEELEDVHSLMLHHMVSFGLGIFYWPQPHSWHFRALHPGNFVFPKRALLNPATWPWCGIITEVAIPDLIAKLDPEQRSEVQAKGWQVPALRTSIEKYLQGEGQKKAESIDVEAIVHAFCDGRLDYDDSHAIKSYIFLVREHDGTVTEYWLTDQAGVDPIFKRNAKFKNMSQVVSIFPMGLGDGYLGHLRGYGVNSLPFHDLEDRHNNRLIDAAWLASSVGLKGDQESLNRLSEMFLGSLFVVPDGFDVEQVGFNNQTASLIEISQLFEAKKAGRSRSFGGPIDVSPGIDPTATGARLRYQEQTGARNGAVGRFYRRLTVFHQALWNRIADPDADENDPGFLEAMEMILMSMQSGLTPDVLSGIKRVVARRIFGDGDANNLFLALSDLSPFFGRLSTGGQQFFIRHLFNARLRNAPEVDAMLTEPELDDREGKERQQAQGENADFQTSDVRIEAGAGDIPSIHAGEHTIFAEDTVTQSENGRIPLEVAFATLNRVRAHMYEGPNAHIERLRADPLSKQIFKDVNNRWGAIDNHIRRLQQMLTDRRKAEQEAQIEEMRNPRPSVKDLETAQTAELERTLMKRRADTELEILRDKAQADIDLKKAMAANQQSGKVVDQKEISATQNSK